MPMTPLCTCNHGGRRHGQGIGYKRTVDIGGAYSAEMETEPQRRTTPEARPPVSERHLVCFEDGNSMGRFSAGDGLQRHDVVESAGRMAAGGSLGQTASSVTGSAARRGGHRFLAGHRGFGIRSSDPRGKKTGPNPVDRAKRGSKHHLIVDANGTPLATILTAANRNDVTQLIPLVDAIPPIRGKPGRPLVKPQEVMGDRGYEGDPKRRILSDRGIATAIARRRTEHGSGLGVYRYVVEQTLALLHQFRRLRVRYDRRDDIHEAFMTLGCAVICGRRLQTRLF